VAKNTKKIKMQETTNLLLVNSVLKLHLTKEIGRVKEKDFTTLKGKEKEAFVKDMNKIKELITEGYNSTMEFISFSLTIIK
jgi:hypothetical protein